MPELTFYFQIMLTFAYIVFVGALYFRNRKVAKAVGDRNDSNEFSQPFFIVLPALKMLTEVCVLWTLNLCFQEDGINITVLRYLTLAEVAFQTVFWAIFCAF